MVTISLKTSTNDTVAEDKEKCIYLSNTQQVRIPHINKVSNYHTLPRWCNNYNL